MRSPPARAAPHTSTTSPRAGARGSARRAPRRCRGGLPRGAWSARGRPPRGAPGRARRAARACPPAAAATRTRRASRRLRRAARASSPRAARQEADEAPALGGQPGGDERGQHRARPGQHLDARGPPRGTRARARSRGRRSAACRRRETSATTAPVAHARDAARARARVRCARGSSPARAGDPVAVEQHAACGACPRRRPRRRSRSAASTRSVTSSRLPIGVGHTTSRPTGASAGVITQI